MASALLIIVILAAIMLAVVLGMILWGMRTQDRDRRHIFRPRRRQRGAQNL